MMGALLVVLLRVSLSQAPASEVSKEDWIARVRTSLPALFCAEGSYFRSCFTLTPQECEERAASTTRICLSDVQDQIPATLKLPDEGRKWGEKVGRCAGQAFEVSLLAKRIHSQKCDDPTAWR